MADRGRVIWIVLEDLELIAIITIEPILGADPQVAAAILKDRQPGILRKSILDRQMLKANDTARREIQFDTECRAG